MSITGLYVLFVLFSILLFNSLILLARYVRQVKEAPKDEEFDSLLKERKQLELDLELQKQEVLDAEERFKKLEERLQKTEDTLQQKLTELQALKSGNSAPPMGAPMPNA